MSKNNPPKAPTLPAALLEDSMLWQLLKAYANEDWDHRQAPWPAPVDAFLHEASRAEAAQLAEDIASAQAVALDDAGWRDLLQSAEVDWRAFTANGDLVDWAQDLQDRALAAAFPVLG